MNHADIVVYGSDKTPQLAVEVKRRADASPQWAARFRRNLATHGQLVHAPFLLLALPDVFYLWKNDRSAIEERLPDYTADARIALAPYLDVEGQDLADLTENGLAFLVSAWLRELTQSPMGLKGADSASRWLIDSGLYDAIKQGEIGIEAVA